MGGIGRADGFRMVTGINFDKKKVTIVVDADVWGRFEKLSEEVTRREGRNLLECFVQVLATGETDLARHIDARVPETWEEVAKIKKAAGQLKRSQAIADRLWAEIQGAGSGK